MSRRLAKQKTCAAKFIGDDFVESIISLSDKKPGRKKVDIVYDLIKADDIQHDLNEDTYQPSTVLCTDEPNEVPQEFSPKIKKTSKAHTPTQKSGVQKGIRTPRTGNRQRSVDSPSSRSTKGKKLNNGVAEDVGTPILRTRMKQLDLNDDVADSDPENSEGEAWEGDSVSDDSCEDLQSDVQKTPKSKQNKKMIAFAESYFSAHKKYSKSHTSNHTMSKVNIPQMNMESLQKMCQETKEYHKIEKLSLRTRHKCTFEKWDFLLQESFSVLLYGVGSKFALLQDFCSIALKDKIYVIINGFFPSLTIRQVLNSVTEDIISYDGVFSNIFEQAEFIKQHFQSGNEELYIIVHNIDGPALRGMKIQFLLSYLAASPYIHFVASVDHVNCPLIWNQVMLSNFKWVWHDVTTYEPYILETSYENSLLMEQSSHLLLSSLIHVFQSLTPNGQGIFLILANLQMDKKDTGNFLGVTFQNWYQKSRDAFLVNSELTMNAQLSEFKNHKLLSSRKSVDGVEHWYIPVDSNTLSEFLEKDRNG